jgi:hypothetical protein
MRPLAILSLVGFIAGTALATCDTSCPPKYTIPTCATGPEDTCHTPTSRLRVRQYPASRLFRRTCDGCPPVECPRYRQKCNPGGQEPPQLTSKTVNLICGQKSTPFSVTYSYVNCPSDDDKKCLVFQSNGQGLEESKLEISSQPLTQSAPGRFSYNSYCTRSTCTVPVDKILENEDIPLGDLCKMPLYIGLHSGYGGETCWAEGRRINEKGNWAMQFSIQFDCPISPPTCCCVRTLA